MMPAKRVFAPSRILTALLATAAVQGMPEKKGRIALLTPWEINSLSLLCFVLLMPSQTTAQSKASMTPNNAIVNAI